MSQQGEEIGTASGGQVNLQDQDDNLTPDINFISSFKLSNNTQGTSLETPKRTPEPAARRIFAPAEAEMEKLNEEIRKLDELEEK